MADFRTEITRKLEAMEDREITRVKDLYLHIDNQIEKSMTRLKTDLDKKTEKVLFDQHVDNVDQRFDFLWKVIFTVGTILGTSTVALVFEAFLNK